MNIPEKIKLPISYTEISLNLQTQKHRLHEQAVQIFQISAKPVNGWQNSVKDKPVEPVSFSAFCSGHQKK